MATLVNVYLNFDGNCEEASISTALSLAENSFT